MDKNDQFLESRIPGHMSARRRRGARAAIIRMLAEGKTPPEHTIRAAGADGCMMAPANSSVNCDNGEG